MEITKIKEQILNTLKGKFEVTNIEKGYFDNGMYIMCEFINRGKRGTFEYTLEGGERGVDEVRNDKGESYIEDKDENIHGEINDWVDNELEWYTIVKWNGKEVE